MRAVAVTGVLRGVIAHWVVHGDTCQADSWQDFSFGINSMSQKKEKKKEKLFVVHSEREKRRKGKIKAANEND